MARVLWRVVGYLLPIATIVGGCIIDNPDYDENVSTTSSSGMTSPSGAPATATTGSTTDSTASGGSMSATGSTSTTGSTDTGATTAITSTADATSLTEASTGTTDDGTTSTGNPDFEPFSIQNYSDGTCTYYAGCFAKQNVYPTKLHATECFSTDLAPPFMIQSVSAMVAFPLGNAPLQVGLHSADNPGAPAIATVQLPPFSGSEGLEEFPLPQPLLVEDSEFCVRLSSGNINTALPMGYDHKTVGTPASYIRQQVDCQSDFVPLTERFGEAQATWCMSVVLGPA